MKLRNILLASSMMAVPLVAAAQPVDGLYIGGGVGANIMNNQTLKSLTIPGALLPATGGVISLQGGRRNGQIPMNAGFTGEGSIGWGFGKLTPYGGPRVELEGTASNNSFGSGGFNGGTFGIFNTPVGLFRATGQENKAGGFLNALWDFDLGVPWVYPYLGVGAGGMWSIWSARFTNQLGPAAALQVPSVTSLSVNNTQGSFAYQAILGASFPIPQVPGLSVTTDFRFIGLAGQRNYSAHAQGVSNTGTFVPNLPAVIGTSNNFNYTFLLGARYAFNVAPPPPPPAPVVAPAPAPARSSLVFFDWDKYNLTDRARQIIAEAAQNSTRVQYTRIEVNGYTDTSGSARYNQGLSVRRAEAVAAELVKDGVPRNAISIQGFGETHLLVPTGPNVREPQNRRVEIIIR